jgi:hypothetical protein
VSSILAAVASFAGKSLLVKHPALAPLRNFLVCNRLVLALVLSGFPPLRPLSTVLLRRIRPLQWLVAPLWSMSVPVLVNLGETALRRAAQHFLAERTPAAVGTRVRSDVHAAIGALRDSVSARQLALVESVERWLVGVKEDVAAAVAAADVHLHPGGEGAFGGVPWSPADRGGLAELVRDDLGQPDGVLERGE